MDTLEMCRARAPAPRATTARATGAGAVRRHGRVWVTLLVVAAGAGLALGVGHVRRRHEIVRLGYELTQATGELRALEEENRRLRLERQMWRHPERVERIAEGRGMRRADPAQVRLVRGGPPQLASVGAAGPAIAQPRRGPPAPRPHVPIGVVRAPDDEATDAAGASP
jgi:cell division protein FtsL